MARCAGGAGRLARHAGAIFAAARRLLFAASHGRFGRGAEIGGLLAYAGPFRRRTNARRTSPVSKRNQIGVIMATEVVMPQMGESIAEGTITKWLKNVGDHVDRDEPLFEISTDKVDAEIPSPAAGTLTEVRYKEGDTVEVNTVVAVLDGNGAAAPAANQETSAAPDSRAESAAQPSAKEEAAAPVETVATETATAPPEPAKPEPP